MLSISEKSSLFWFVWKQIPKSQNNCPSFCEINEILIHTLLPKITAAHPGSNLSQLLFSIFAEASWVPTGLKATQKISSVFYVDTKTTSLWVSTSIMDSFPCHAGKSIRFSQNSSICTCSMWAATNRLYHYFNKTTDKQLNTKDHFISQITPLSFS